MRILAIGIQNSGSRPGYSGLFHPFGIAYISAVLKNKGHSVDCIDLHNEEILNGMDVDSWGIIRSYHLSEYDVIAFGGTFLKFKILKSLSEKIWQYKNDIFQVAGGNMATIISDVILKETKVNAVCLCEGEETISEFVDNLDKGSSWKLTRGIKYLTDSGDVEQTPEREKIYDLDKIPFPDRSSWMFDINRKAFPYGSPGRYCAIMFASRGCPFSCIFCNPLAGHKIRSRSAANIIDEIKYLKKEWNIGYIRFFDENFIGSKQKIKEICQLMISEKLDIYWWCQTQIRFMDEETLKLMKMAGCIEIAYGVESGSDTILLEMRKGITAEAARKTIEMTNNIGIKPSLNFIAGTPSETYETLEETKKFVISLNHIDWVQVPTIDFIVPLPGTELYDIAKNKGFITDEKKYLTEELFKLGRYSKGINLTTMPDEGFRSYIEKCNSAIKSDYYSRQKMKKILQVFGLDHLRLDLIFKNFSLRHTRPLVEALLWAFVGKRNNPLGRFISRAIYGRPVKEKKMTYWKTFLGIPKYKIDWYARYYLYKIFGFVSDKIKDQREYWNTRGIEYYEEFFDTEYYKYEIFFQDLLISELRNLNFKSIFEAGCGFGWNVKRVKKEFPNTKIGGLDFSLPQLKNTRLYEKDIVMPVTQGDACTMPFCDDAFDAGFTMGVFMNIHPSKIGGAIDEMIRVSKKYIVHIEWDQNNTKPPLKEKRIFKTNIVSHDYKKLYEERGMKVLKFETYRDFEDSFYRRYPSTRVKAWEQFEGPEKYTVTIVKNSKAIQQKHGKEIQNVDAESYAV